MWRPLSLILASAGLLVLAVPPSHLGWLAWVALVPLVLAIQGSSTASPGQSPAAAALSGALFGAASAVGMHHWLWGLSKFNVADAIVICAYFAIYPAAFCAGLAWLHKKQFSSMASGALLWTLLYVLRSNLGFLSVPWEPLAHAETENLPLLQAASLGGAPLVTFIVCLANMAVARAARARNIRLLVWPAVGVLVVHAYGFWRVIRPPDGASLEVAVIQPVPGNEPPATRLALLRELTLQAAEGHPDLIVWPESAVQAYAFDAVLRESMADLARTVHASILFGSADFGKYAESAGRSPGDAQFKNQAVLVTPGGTTQGPYTKNRLVPFAETMPMTQYITWPRWLVARQLHGIAGDSPGLFRLPDGRTVGALICWENLFTDLSARLAKGGAVAIVQLTNDSDFEGRAEPVQHSVASALRSVEYGRPVVVASASGPSIVIDAHGRVHSELGQGTRGWMQATVNTETATTVYTVCGLHWLWLAAMVVVAVTALQVLARRREHETSYLA